MHLRSVRHRLRLLVALSALGLAAGCGGPEEPSEIPASPPPGKGLPRFAQAPAPVVAPTSLASQS